MPLKRFKCRLTIDFVAEIDPINEDSVHSYAGGFTNRDEVIKDPGTWEWSNQQRRLLQALLSDPEALERYMAHAVRDTLEVDAPEWIKQKLGRGDHYKEDLAPVIASLSNEDREFFESAIENSLITENTDIFLQSFRYEPLNIDLQIEEDQDGAV